MMIQPISETRLALLELEKFSYKAQNELPARYEIDSDIDPDFGTLYRVWQSYHLCGTFYQDIDGLWVSQPCKSDFRPRVRTELQAQLIIIAVYENSCLQTE